VAASYNIDEPGGILAPSIHRPKTKRRQLMNIPEIKYAKESDRGQVLSTVTLAFAADPLARWLLPSAEGYLLHMQAIANAYGGRSIDGDTCLRTDGFEGAALWLAPGVEPDEESMVSLIEKTLAPEVGANMLEVLERMGEYHPTEEDCWYLTIIGVDPGHQNKGMGSALMKHMTAKLDSSGAMAYLESSNPLNISLYQRHGFEIMGEIQVADSPVITPMVRSGK
jgi:ribosomal protein S18 acetylase RimI-like enzyme